MLRTPAPFPQVGSFALFSDTTLPIEQQRPELVRILRAAGDDAAIAFPLRLGATGNRTVALADLIDATPLTDDEKRELADLQRELRGRRNKHSVKAVRCHGLAERAIFEPILTARLADLAIAGLRRAA